MTVRARAAALLTAGLALCTAPAADAAFPGSNGTIAYLNCNTDTCGIWSRAADGTGFGLVPGSGYHDDMPAWSADGTRIALRDNSNGTHVVVRNADWSNPIDLTAASDAGPTVVDQDPAWAPDGTKIAFELPHLAATDGGVAVVPASATPATTPTMVVPYTSGILATGPDWSPDGSSLLVTAAGADDFRVVDASTGAVQHDFAAPRTSSQDFFRYLEAVFSPDGTKILFTEQHVANGSYPPWHLSTVPVTGTPADAVELPHDASSTLARSPSWGVAPGTSTLPATAVPTNTAPPSIDGTAQVGHTLAESHGAWTGGPTSFSHQWERCDGGRCEPIAGATAQTYDLADADAGATIVVQEIATNAGGPSKPALSAPSARIAPADTPGSSPGAGGTLQYTSGGSGTGFHPVVSVEITGYLSAPPPLPQISGGRSIDQGAVTDGQEIFRGSNLTVTPTCVDAQNDIAACELQIEGPAGTTPWQGGAQRMPASANGTYTIRARVRDAAGEIMAVAPWTYVVGDPPTSSQVGAAAGAAVGGAIPGVVDQIAFDQGGGAYRIIEDPATHRALVLVGADGTLQAAMPGGNVINAGAGNVINAGAGNIINAGAYNLTGTLNFLVVDATGTTVAIIAAGAGNLHNMWNVVPAGPGTGFDDGQGGVIAWNAPSIINAGAHNIIAAGAGNVIAAGAGNIINAGAHNLGTPVGIINAGAHNFAGVGVLGGAASDLVSGIVTPGALDGALVSSNIIAAGANNLLGHASAAKARTRAVLATGATVLPHAHARAALVQRLTARGRKLVKRLAAMNRKRIKHHRKPVRVRLEMVWRVRSETGVTRTVTRTFEVAPGTRHVRRR